MIIQRSIEAKLQVLNPLYLEVMNESSMHNVPEGSESHFKVTIVSAEFVGKMLVARHRLVNTVLADVLARSVHALALHTKTEEEWFEAGAQSLDSPPCFQQ